MNHKLIMSLIANRAITKRHINKTEYWQYLLQVELYHRTNGKLPYRFRETQKRDKFNLLSLWAK